MKIGFLAFVSFYLFGIAFLNAQDTPAAREDAREERLKILRAADQIDLLQTNSDKLQVEVANLKEQLVKLQDANTSQQQQISALKTALEKSEDARAKEREVLLNKVGEMIAASKPTPAKDTTPNSNTSHDTEHGYYYTVEKGQTLSQIAAAYSDKGVKVSVEDIQKANNLGPKDIIKPGQKLFIPKK